MEKFNRLEREFFMTDAINLAKKLLNKVIIRYIDNIYIKYRIIETEAYMGVIDRACHSYGGRKTERTKHFWNEGGHLYIYSIYGTNICLDIVANDRDTPEGVLIRAVEPLNYMEKIIGYRTKIGKKSNFEGNNLYNLTNGPGKVGEALRIDKSFNSVDLCESELIFIVDECEFDEDFEIKESKRVNVKYAGQDADNLWRFYIKDNKYISKVKENK